MDKRKESPVFEQNKLEQFRGGERGKKKSLYGIAREGGRERAASFTTSPSTSGKFPLISRLRSKREKPYGVGKKGSFMKPFCLVSFSSRLICARS